MFLGRRRDERQAARPLRSRRTLRSSLEELPGVGARRTKDLLRHFGSLKGVREAELDALKDVPGLPVGVAESIYRAYHPGGVMPAEVRPA